MTYHTAIQMRQRMRVSSSFFERKKSGECSVHSQVSSAFRDCGASRRGRTPQLNCIKPSQEYSKKETAECVYLLTQDTHCDSRDVYKRQVQGCAASREGGFCSIQFDADFGALAESKGDILGISAMVWIWPRQNYRKTPGNLEAEA